MDRELDCQPQKISECAVCHLSIHLHGEYWMHVDTAHFVNSQYCAVCYQNPKHQAQPSVTVT